MAQAAPLARARRGSLGQSPRARIARFVLTARYLPERVVTNAKLTDQWLSGHRRASASK